MTMQLLAQVSPVEAIILGLIGVLSLVSLYVITSIAFPKRRGPDDRP